MDLPRLTLITANQGKCDETFFQALNAALSGGVGQLLVREKGMDSAHLLAFASKVRDITRAHQAKLIIHSQADIAKAVAADGVHLASSDLHEIPAMRAWLDQAGMSISTSCHNVKELQESHYYGADYAMLSPVFPTLSHPDAPALGVKKFKEIAAASSLPVIALGGINSQTRKQIADFPVATIRAILHAENPKQAAQSLL
ncbi:MAG: thiamine phosphate synthase [Mariprofundaceae bacterium]|nr:thiamine phosphate synthase [Mariprofundaceae bacterium]